MHQPKGYFVLRDLPANETCFKKIETIVALVEAIRTCFQSSSSFLEVIIFFNMKAWTGAMTTQGPPSNCTRAVGSSGLNENPVEEVD